MSIDRLSSLVAPDVFCFLNSLMRQSGELMVCTIDYQCLLRPHLDVKERVVVMEITIKNP